MHRQEGLETQTCLKQKVSELKKYCLKTALVCAGKKKQEFNGIIKFRFFFCHVSPKSKRVINHLYYHKLYKSSINAQTDTMKINPPTG